jgi:sigma-B regulation protein RsbU (phosphoserine phosphatase)
VKILIAEDEYTTRLMVQVCLEEWGYTVETAEDGDSAWKMMEKEAPPEIAILDWEMPGLSGVDLCRRIKNMKRNSPIHVIMLTARDSKNDMSRGFDAGADDYITKPFNDDELRARIKVAERIVTIQSSLNNSLHELKQALNLIDSYQEQILVCPKCSKIESFDGTWRNPADLLTYPVDPRFFQRDCPECKKS